MPPSAHLLEQIGPLAGDRELGIGGAGDVTAGMRQVRNEALVPAANPKQLTEACESVDSSIGERSLQIDLEHVDRAVPNARCVGSRSPCASAPAQCPAAQIAETARP
jgi:hypothetical protein